ncbi:hypothetical protein NB231_12466 [Nitrococcus mobilis Nb-231]|uniref:Uncharacterized protein n=1 Tax=Nitrococcus mobilis Nb-231 TaxID=314278 RepID=A4BU28_9GAMM|nr:hypothetical protein NB231_12466 [Nitrococcus mobilis Nb-231]
MMNVQKRIKKALSLDKERREVALRELAKELGCSLSSTYGGGGSKHLEDELVRRIQEAARSIRESRLWWFAVIASVSSAISALAAWCAVILLRVSH